MTETPDRADEDPAVTAAGIVAELFEAPQAAFLGGSAVTSRRTPSSDLDVVVVLAELPAPYRQTIRSHGWLVELFVHDSKSLREYYDRAVRSRVPTMIRLCALGVVIADAGGIAPALQQEAAALLAAGPQPVPVADLELRRYLLTDLLDDVRDCPDEVELGYLTASVLQTASELALAASGRWSGRGKWLPRCLGELRVDWPVRLVEGQRAVLVEGDRSGLDGVVAEILELAGGPLQEGYRS